MILMNPKQFDEKHRGVVFSNFVVITPFGDALNKFLVKIRRLNFGCAHYLVGNSRSATDSISA
jgi:hypothetical protein